jgi:uncharacterized RDD family membrane protein YckC
MQWTDDIRIETPEQIDVSLELAGIGSRFVAWVVDGLIKLAVLLVAGLLGGIVLALLGTRLEDKGVQIFVGALLFTLYYALLLGYDIYFEVRHNGQTPGKKQAGIRVIREGGAPVDFRSAAIRSFLWVADYLPCFYLLGGLLVLLSARRQRLGDLAAGTLIIRERALQPPAELDEQINRLAFADLVFTADQLAGCGPNDRHILRSFFQRYPQLEPQPRHQLACKLAEEFLRKTDYDVSTPISIGSWAEGFLASLYRDMENRLKHDR